MGMKRRDSMPDSFYNEAVTEFTRNEARFMNTTDTIPAIPYEIKEQLGQTLSDLVKGIRRPDKMKAACERMDRMREENRRLSGEQKVAVELIRETRDHA
jgi:hypothetical protein